MALVTQAIRETALAVRSVVLGPWASGDRRLIEVFGSRVARAGVAVSDDTALTYSAFWCAVLTIAGDVATLPLHLYRRLADGGKERMTDHVAHWLMHDEPNEEMSAVDFREALTGHALTWGNGYAEIQFNGKGQPVALWLLDPWTVYPERNDRGVLQYRVRNGTRDTIVPADRMFHLRGLTPDGVCGYHVTDMARDSIGLGIATERFGSAFFGNGAAMGGVLVHPARMSKESREKFQKFISERHQGVDRAHGMLVLEEGMKYERTGVEPDAAQFLETRKFQLSEIARWFNLPLHKLKDLDRATFSNIEHQDIEYVNDTLGRWLVKWEQEGNRKLVRPLERGIQFFEHVREARLRGDVQSRYNAYAVGRNWGWLSVDEIRDRENMNPLPNGAGRQYLVPTNMVPADRVDEVIDAQVAPKPAPAPAPAPVAEPPEPDTAAEERMAAAMRTAFLDLVQPKITELRERLDAIDLPAEEAIVAAIKADLAATAENVVIQGISEASLTRDAIQKTIDQIESLRAAVAAVEHAHAATRDQVAATVDAARAEVREVGVELATRLNEQEQRSSEAVAAVARAVEERAGRLEERIGAIPAPPAPVDLTPVVGRVDELEARTAEAVAAVARAVEERTGHLEERIGAIPVPEPVDLAPVREEFAAAREEQGALFQQQESRFQALQEQAEAIAATQQTLAERLDAAEAERQALRAQLAAVAQPLRELIADAVLKEVRVECDRARKAAVSAEKLRAWMDTFYAVREDITVQHLVPALRPHFVLVGREADAEAETRRLIRAHIEESRSALEALIDSATLEADVETLVARWESERPAAIADALLREVIAHA